MLSFLEFVTPAVAWQGDQRRVKQMDSRERKEGKEGKTAYNDDDPDQEQERPEAAADPDAMEATTTAFQTMVVIATEA